jgi:hypothetical protein
MASFPKLIRHKLRLAIEIWRHILFELAQSLGNLSLNGQDPQQVAQNGRKWQCLGINESEGNIAQVTDYK